MKVKSKNQKNIDEWNKYSQEEIESFGDDGDLSRQYILTPALLSAIGEFKSKNILDAGSGTGYLSRKLAKLGAKVTGVEPSESMFKYCVDRESKENLGIKYYKQDLSELALKEEFDIVVANMVLQDIAEYKNALKSCIDILKSDGIFIFTVLHPFWDYLEYEKSYFENYSIKLNFGSFFHRTIEEYVTAINESNGRIVSIAEPKPISRAKGIADLKKDFERPNFVLFVIERSYN